MDSKYMPAIVITIAAILLSWIADPGTIIPTLIVLIGFPVGIYYIWKLAHYLKQKNDPQQKSSTPSQAEAVSFHNHMPHRDMPKEEKSASVEHRGTGTVQTDRRAEVINSAITEDKLFTYRTSTVRGRFGVEIVAYNGFDEKTISIPRQIGQYDVIRIGTKAFVNAEVETVDCPETLLEIAESAFTRCKKLWRINIPNSIKKIESHAFSYCTNLKKMILPEGLKELGSYVFSETGVSEISFPSSLAVIPDGCCKGCLKLRKIAIAEGVKRIDSWAFDATYHSENWHNELQSIVIPQSVQLIERDAFAQRIETALVFLGMNTTGQEYDDASKRIATLRTVFYVLPGSAIQRYAREHGFLIKPLEEFKQD